MSKTIRIPVEPGAWAEHRAPLALDLRALFAQPRNAFREDFWRLRRDMPRIIRDAALIATRDGVPAISIFDYVDRTRDSRSFRD